MESTFDASFVDCSYGFQSKQSPTDAVRNGKNELLRGWWVLYAGIEGFFDAADHEVLLWLVRRCISDRRILKLIRQWLTPGIGEEAKWRPSEKGTTQGCVISPLLANIYLHILDRHWEIRYAEVERLIRYCNDFVVVCKSRRNAEKARLVAMDREGFDFVGFHFRKMPSRRTGTLLP